MALSTVKKAFTSKPSYAGDPNCDFLAEACRRATAKNAYHPDENLKALIVNKINETTPGAQVPIKVTYDIIRRRLQMENPHKQWLAVDLTRHLLSASKERLRPYRTELLYHVARVAIKPNKKGPITAQHNARKAATDFLHQCGDEGQDALRMARMQLGNMSTQNMSMAPMGGFGPDGMGQGFGAPGMPYSTVPTSQHSSPKKDNGNAQARIANVQHPTGDVMKDVRNLIDTADSHSSVLNELILASSEEQRESNAPLLAELKQEMLQVKDMFPRLLEQLSMLKTPGSEELMKQALEAHEQIDQCLDMERQYAEGLQAEAELAKDREAGHLRDDDDDEEEDVEEADEGAEGEKEEKVQGDEENKSPSAAAVSPQALAQPAPAFDLLNFDSGPLPAAGASGNATGKSGEPQSEDLFGLGALQSNLPSPGGAVAPGAPVAAPSAAGATSVNDDPFMSNEPLGGQSNAAASTPSQQPSSNPFATQPQGAAPVAGASVSETASNPFGSNAFSQPSPGASVPPGSPMGHPAGSAPQGQGFPGNPAQQQPQQQGGNFMYNGVPPGHGQPMQFQPGGGPPSPYGGNSIPPGHFGGHPGHGAPPGQGMPGQGMPGQFMGGHTGPQGMPPQPPGFQMYGQPQGWGAPGQAQPGHPFGNSAFPSPQGGAQQQFSLGPGFNGPPQGQYGGMRGAPTQQFAQTPPMQGYGGPPAANPFAPQQPIQMQQAPGQFGGSATGFPPQQANPFATTSTGLPPWNPHGQKDAFGDLIHEHNKRTTYTPPMTAPMRPQDGGANGLL